MYSERDRRVASQNKNALDRRQFLKLLTLGAGAVFLESDSGSRAPAKFDGHTYHSTNERLFQPIETKPDYMRTAEKIILSLPGKELLTHRSTLLLKKGKEYVTGTEQDKENANQEIRTEVRQMYHDLLKSLPQYSEITMLYGKTQAELFHETTALSPNVQNIHGAQIDEFRGDQWVQDFGESVVWNGQSKFLIPLRVASDDFSDTLNNDMKRLRERQSVSQQYFGEKNIITAPFYFGGGNLACDYINGQLTVFIGSGDVTRTIDIYRELGRRLSSADVAALISEQFHGAPVVIMGHLEQHSQLNFHIDQSFIFLQDQQVVMNMYDTRGVREPDIEIQYVQQQQECFIQQLEALGYDVHLLQNTGRDLELHYASTNAVPFIHKITGEPTIIFPVFPDEIEGDFNDQHNLVGRLLGKAQAGYHLYEKLGYTPIPVRDFANVGHGNTHCLANVLVT